MMSSVRVRGQASQKRTYEAESVRRLLSKSQKAYQSKSLTKREQTHRTARHALSPCRAVHQQLPTVAKSYPQVQRFLAEGSDRALGKL